MLLTRAQRAEQDARMRVAAESRWDAASLETKATFWAAEVGRLRVELRALLYGTSTDETAPTTEPQP